MQPYERSEAYGDPSVMRVSMEPGEDLGGAIQRAAGGPTPPRKEYGDIPVSIWADWNVRAIRNAVSAHAAGTFGPAGLLVEAMLADDRVQAATNGRIKGVTRCEPVFTPAPSPQGVAVAEELDYLWDELVPEETLEQMLVWSTHLGFALCEVIWEPHVERGEARWLPRLKPWHPLSIWYNVADRSYNAITMEGSIKVEPDDPKWFLFTPWGAYRGWLRGAVRSVSIPWIVRQFGLRDMARYSEKHGLPMVVARAPAQSPAEDKARFFASVRNLGSDTAMILPSQGPQTNGVDWDVTLLEARDRSWEAFPALRHECDRAITLAIRGTNLTTEVDGGSYAASKSHREEDEDYAVADRKKLANALRRQLLSWYCLYNHGDPDLCPKLDLRPPETQLPPDQVAKVWGDLGTAVAALVGQGVQVDLDQVADRFGVPVMAPKPGEEKAEDRPRLSLTPSDTAQVVTVNEARLSQGLGKLMTPAGEEDPDGELTISQFVAKRTADTEQAAEERPEEEQERKLEEAEKFGLPVPGQEPAPGEEGAFGDPERKTGVDAEDEEEAPPTKGKPE